MVDAKRDRGDGMHEATDSTSKRATDERAPRAVVVTKETGAPRTEDHHALETDVHDARAFAEQSAERGQQDGQRERNRVGDGELRGEVVLSRDRASQRQHEERSEEHQHDLSRTRHRGPPTGLRIGEVYIGGAHAGTSANCTAARCAAS